MIMKSLKLAYGVQRGDTDKVRDYKVLIIKNSTEYHPGQILSLNEVTELCVSKAWDVAMVTLKEGD